MSDSQLQELRARLASRQSFFGGKVSTREAVISPSWNEPAKEAEALLPQKAPQPQVKRKVASVPAAEPEPDPLPVKRQKLQSNRDFSFLGSTEQPTSQPSHLIVSQGVPRSGTPPPQPRSKTPPLHPQPDTPHGSAHPARGPPAAPAASIHKSAQLQHRRVPAPAPDNAIHSPADIHHIAHPAVPRAKSATPPPRAVVQAYAKRAQSLPPPRTQPKQQGHRPSILGASSSRMGKNMTGPKGKKGVIARSLAVDPKAVGNTTRKGLANAALRMQIDAMRPGRPQQAERSEPHSQPRSKHSAPAHPPKLATASGKPASMAKPLPAPGRQQPVGQKPASRIHTSQPSQSAAGGKPAAGSHASLASQMRRPAHYESETDDDDDFLEEEDGGGDWRSALKEVTGYDPSRYRNERYDDHDMEASWQQIQAEERRSARLGRTEDEIAEQEELRRTAAKQAKKAKRKSHNLVDA